MSAVRMCDRCGNIFAEGAEGAAVGTVTVNERNPRNGRIEAVQKSQDVCPPCARPEAVAPRLAVTATTDDPGAATTVATGNRRNEAAATVVQ